MQSKTIILLSLFFSAIAGLNVQGSFGSAVSVDADVDTTINFGIAGINPSLTINVDQDAQVTLSLLVSAETSPLPRGYNLLTQSAGAATNIGYTFNVTPSTATFSANLTGGILAQTALALLSQVNIKAGLLQFDATAKTYNQIAVAVPSIAQQLSFSLPSVGSYAFVAFNIQSPIPTFYGYARQLAANVANRIVYLVNATEQFAINVTSSVQTDLKVDYSTSISGAANFDGYVALDAYFQIETASPAQVAANLSYTFDQAVLAAKGITADTLVFAYQTASGWKIDGSATVSGNVVTQGTTHFSQWGVYGQSGTSNAATIFASISLIICTIFTLL
eukprot:TRINITY_DN1114_c0_g2_i1.p1 TRINITY_DN1114_c0_g2~~TRINITY_DN1114_c0_g2_i1.p1  ORF type:complete len:334 (-),score=102.61 TRINITY_DN1114_c0_g2_i1:160-1161(-)